VARSLYLAAAGPESGKSAVALAVLEAMRHRVGRVAVFRPVVRAHGEDPVLTLLGNRLADSPGAEAFEGFGVSYDQVHADPDAAISAIVERYHVIEQNHDAVLIVGTDYTDVGAPTELAFNGRSRSTSGHRCCWWSAATSAPRRTCWPPSTWPAPRCTRSPARCSGWSPTGWRPPSWTRCAPDWPPAGFGRAARDPDAVRPERPAGPGRGRRHPGVRAAEPGPARGARLHRRRDERCPGCCGAGGPTTGDRPGDRSDILVGVLTAHASHTFPRLSGVLLTGGMQPEPIVRLLIDGLRISLPVGSTQMKTFESAVIASTTRGR